MKRELNSSDSMILWQTPSKPPDKHDYVFRNGRRYVRPYFFEFISHVKARWSDRVLVDLFSEEFRGRSREYYVSAAECGRLQVDGQKISSSYVVKQSQKISHFLHRHEPPVTACDISIIHEDADVVAVCKPPTIPVHSCGQYNKNTVTGILQAEHGLFHLYPVHRLDRLVSGLLIFARSASKANLFRTEIESGAVQKQYIARVLGTFPDHEQIVDLNVNYNPREGKSTAEKTDWHVAKGKTACTKFLRMGTNGTHSVVLCTPITGRTHQIRVHLQSLGYPIANDFLYNSDYIANRSSGGTSADRAARVPCHASRLEEERHQDDIEEDFSTDDLCPHCPSLTPKGYDLPEEGLWLHCVQYSGPGWVYNCPHPPWADLS